MSQISPYARSTAERSTNRKTTALLLGVAAASCLVTVSLLVQRNPPDSDDSDKGQTEIASAAVDGEAVIDWSTRIAGIERDFPHADNVELHEVKHRLRTIASLLKTEALSTDTQSSVQRKLDGLRQLATTLSDLVERPPAEIEGFTESVNSTAQSILFEEQEAIQQARDSAESDVRREVEPKIRVARLDVRDQQDKAANLRRQIAQLQREQEMFRAKAARTEALRREMPDVESYLSPFTAPGHLQPESDSNAWDVERTADAKPVSLARLKRLGALEQTMEGLERLYIFGGGKNAVLNNSRPLGSFPQHSAQQLSKPEVLAAVKRAQQLIRDHGQALVEEQLLSP